jgi:hypothetical protein
MIKKPAKGKPLSRTVKSTKKSAVKRAKDKPLSRTVKSTKKRTVKSTKKRTVNKAKGTPTKKAKLTQLAELVAKWDKDQGPVPTLYDTAGKLDEVVNTLTDIQHLMDCALDDCVDLVDNARALSLLYLAHGMVKGVIDKTDAVTSDLYRINRKSLG